MFNRKKQSKTDNEQAGKASIGISELESDPELVAMLSKAQKKALKKAGAKDKPRRFKKRKSSRKLNSERQVQLEQQVNGQVLSMGLTLKSKAGRAAKKRLMSERNALREHVLQRLAPVGNIIFYSDYFMIDSSYASILTLTATKGHIDDLPPMWGLRMVPRLFDEKYRDKVTAKLQISYSKRNKDWAEKKLTDATGVADSGIEEARKGGHGMEVAQYRTRQFQTQEVSEELANGAAYLDMSIRILIKAPSMELLDDAVETIRRQYASTLASSDVALAKFFGEQQSEYAAMVDTAREQLGQNFQLPSIEAAGSYPFMNKPLEDPNGSYVGSIANDVNTGAVMWDTMAFDQLMLVGAADKAEDIQGKHDYAATAGWGMHVTQDALISGRRVFHIVLNNQNILGIGRSLTDISVAVPMDSGALNMFEAWGRSSDELSAYNVLINKIKLMVQLLAGKVSANDISAINALDLGVLTKELEKFYVDKELWHTNAAMNRDRLSLVGIPHIQVPILRQFVPYIESAYKSAHANGGMTADGEDEKSLNKLSLLFTQIHNLYADLFDHVTFVNDADINQAKQVIFELGRISIRGNEPLMAQFINTLTYVEQQMNHDDVLLIHGADQLSTQVEEFLDQRMKAMFEKDIKVVLLYDSPEEMTKRANFIEKADVILSGKMAASAIGRYKEHARVDLPSMVTQAMGGSDRRTYVLNRDHEVSVFNWDSWL